MSVSLGGERHRARAPSPGGYRVARTRRNSMSEYRSGVTSPHTPCLPQRCPLCASLRSVSPRSSLNPLASSALLRFSPSPGHPTRSSTSTSSQRTHQRGAPSLRLPVPSPFSLFFFLFLRKPTRFLFVAPATSFPRHLFPSLLRSFLSALSFCDNLLLSLRSSSSSSSSSSGSPSHRI